MMAEKKSCAQALNEAGLSVIKACLLTSLPRPTFYRKTQNWREKDKIVIDTIQTVLAKSPQAVFWKCYFRLRFQGYPFNHKRVYRVYCRLGLNLKRSVKKVLPVREKRPLLVENKPNIQWALDFIHDNLYCGKRFRTLNIIDEGTRESLSIEVDTLLPAERVIRILERLKTERGLPKQIRVDNRPELISINLLNYCETHHVELCHIHPASHSKTALLNDLMAHFAVNFI